MNHDHAWETLDDGTVVCFECDAAKAAAIIGPDLPEDK